MALSRRFPPPLPELSRQARKSGEVTWEQLIPLFSSLDTYLRGNTDVHQGLPASHAKTHRPDADSSDPAIGRDPLPIGVPSDVGTENDEGSSNDFVRGDHAHRLGIATTKGDLITHNGTDPLRLAVGSNGQALIADSTQTSGLTWGLPASHASLEEGLILSLRMEEGDSQDRYDSVGSVYMRSVAGVTRAAAGKIGNAAQFTSASSQYLTCEDLSVFDVTSAMTISVWIYLDTSTGNRTIASKWLYMTDGGFTLEMVGGEVRLWVANAANDAGTSLGGFLGWSPSTGAWHHVIVVYDGTQTGATQTATDLARIKIYTDGSTTSQTNNNGSGAVPSTIRATSSSFNVGRWEGLGRYFNGRIDGLHIWNRALSAPERAYMYNSGTGREVYLRVPGTLQDDLEFAMLGIN